MLSQEHMTGEEFFMGKERKQASVWKLYGRGLLLSWGVYLLLILLLSLLLTRGVMGWGSAFPAVAVCALSASFVGGLSCVRRAPWGTLPSALLCAAGFGAMLAAVGLLCWEGGVTWLGKGGILLGAVLSGGVLAGLLGGRRRGVRRGPRR
jgi:hypothetical protein